GNLWIRGPWICSGYLNIENSETHGEDDWFLTGDVATIDPDGFMQITDRTKDVIKSGGEWISSIEIENFAVGHSSVMEAGVIGVFHPKWDERPLLILVKNENSEVTKEEILEFLKDKIASWWMPDDVVFVDSLPHTATGKIQKLVLREQFKDYKLEVG
ncbi:MAG: AMP-binding protein, partial [Pelagibacterales bacterium]|nr:AMP-binding protein [Pelagibacterales bacterium]